MKSTLLSIAFAGGILFSTGALAQTTSYDENSLFAVSNPYTSTSSEEVAIVGANGFNDLFVYPNPVASSTRIVLDQVPGSSVFVDVIDLNGRVDRSFQYAPGTYQLDVDMSDLPTGMYSVRVSGKDVGYHNLKVVKE